MENENLIKQEDVAQCGENAVSQVEDRVLKIAAQFFGKDLLPYIVVKGRIGHVAPTEHVHLEMRKMEEDFNFFMEDGSWRHLEFESDSITVRDLRRFREYEAYIGMIYDVPVITTVLCTSDVRILRRELVNGDSIYRVEIVRIKDKTAESVFKKLENRITKGKKLRRRDVFPILLSPLLSGKMDMCERIIRGMGILQRSELDVREDEIKRMQSVLYALAVKFLKHEELENVKERIGMTVLGQMICEDALGKGIEKGIEALVLDNLEEGKSRERIVGKLIKRFSLKEHEANAYYEKYAAETLGVSR